MHLSAGDRVDRYEIVAFLGSGGMGEVYRARDPKLQRDIALKVLHVDGALATDGRQRLLREARAVAALSHPNVLAVFDVGEVTEPEHLRGMTYIAMELIVGSALRAHFGDETIPMERRLAWLQDIARALAAAHDAGLVHRDVKPENVMIRFDGAVKVLDFGIARHVGKVDALSSTEGHSLSTINTDLGPPAAHVQIAASTRTAPGRIVGTLYYMAPEQLRGESVDGRVDQFAWGVVAYELLTGKRPWLLGPDLIAIASQILSHTPRAPAEIEPRISPALSEVIMHALAKDAVDRFPTMGDLLASLEEAAIAGTGRERFPAPWRKTTSPSAAPASSRRLWLAYALSASALVGAVDAALYVARTRHGSPIAAVTPSSLASDGCTSSAACSRHHGGGAWHCHSVRHECVEIASADCKPMASPAALTSDETVWIGALYPGRDGEGALSEARALELARQDFDAALGSGAQGAVATRARPIGIVMCDEKLDPSRAAQHLASDVEVPAIAGFRSASTARSVIPSVFAKERILSFIAISSAPDLPRIPEPPSEPRLIWRSTLDANDIAMPLATLVSQVLEPRAQAGGGSSDSEIRVALTRENAGYDVADEIFRVLKFNGRSALLNGDNLRQFVVDEAVGAPSDTVVEALLAFRPQVIFVSGPSFMPNVLIPLEKRWGAGRRPTYLIGSGEWTDEFLRFAGKDPQRRHRFFGVTNMSTRMTNAQLVLHYNRAFPTEPVLRTNAPSPSYDAFYTLAYAIIALGDDPITGPSISRALDRLQPPGRPIDVGPQSIFDAFTTLRSGQNIDLNGAIGNLDFNRETGEAPIDYAIVCLGVDDHGAAAGAVESGLVYDAVSKKLVGTMHCP